MTHDIIWYDLQEFWNFTWWVSDCEKLVGGFSQVIMGWVLTITSI